MKGSDPKNHVIELKGDYASGHTLTVFKLTAEADDWEAYLSYPADDPYTGEGDYPTAAFTASGSVDALRKAETFAAAMLRPTRKGDVPRRARK